MLTCLMFMHLSLCDIYRFALTCVSIVCLNSLHTSGGDDRTVQLSDLATVDEEDLEVGMTAMD